MKDSEILRDLISLAFDSNPADTNIALRDCLDLLGRTIIAENAGGCAEIVAKKHSLVTGQTPTTPAAGRVIKGPKSRRKSRHSTLLASVLRKSARSMVGYLITEAGTALVAWLR